MITTSPVICSPWRFVRGTTAPDGAAPIISWTVSPGQTYSVEYKDDLNAGNWQAVPGSVTIVGNQGCLTDTTLTAGHRFYRVVSGN